MKTIHGMWVLFQVMCLSGFVYAQELENQTMLLGGIENFEQPFSITGAKVGDESLAEIRYRDNILTVTAKRVGNSQILITGEGLAAKRINLVVEPNAGAMLRKFQQIFDDLPEVTLSEGPDGKVLVEGEITDPAHWRKLNKIVATYSTQLVSLADFVVHPNILIDVKKSLEAASFKVVRSIEDAQNQIDVIAVDASEMNVLVSGTVLSQKRADQLMHILGSQRYLVMKSDEAGATSDEKLMLIPNIEVMNMQLELDVAFITVDEELINEQGINLLKSFTLAFSSVVYAAEGTIRRTSNSTDPTSGNYTMNLGLEDSINLFERFKEADTDGIVQSRAHLTFKSGQAKPATFRSGGTLNVPVQGGVGGNSSLEPIPYGLSMAVTGVLRSMAEVDLDMKLEFSEPTRNPQFAGAIDLLEQIIDAPATIPIGKTMVMGGMNQVLDSVSDTGVPYLRKVPIFRNLFNEKSKRTRNLKLLILASPRLAPQTFNTVPTSESTTPIGKP